MEPHGCLVPPLVRDAARGIKPQHARCGGIDLEGWVRVRVRVRDRDRVRARARARDKCGGIDLEAAQPPFQPQPRCGSSASSYN